MQGSADSRRHSRRGQASMSCPGKAKQAATPQRAPVEVIAQTQWQLQSVRPESHDFLRNSAGRLQRITAAVSKAAHGKVPSSVPPRQGMARERHASGGRKMLPAKSILKQGNAERVQSTVLRLQKGTAQSATKTPVAMKQLKRSAITKYALESRQDGSDDRVPSLLGPAVSGQRTQWQRVAQWHNNPRREARLCLSAATEGPPVLAVVLSADRFKHVPYLLPRDIVGRPRIPQGKMSQLSLQHQQGHSRLNPWQCTMLADDVSSSTRLPTAAPTLCLKTRHSI